MAESDHHSIGEVLVMIQQDFPDVTISKIRFLESQGLLEPDRTTSGYRKFYDDDVARLRWILHQQRDHYLPLKVIKDRIVNGYAEEEAEDGDEESVDVDDHAAPASVDEVPPPVEPQGEPSASTADPLDEGLSTVSMTADELGAASGLSAEEVHDLRRFGLVEARTIGAADFFEGEALQIARLAADFVRLGVEIRHLKMYRVSAQREAGFYQQVVSPYANHRDPAMRSRARGDVRDLVRLGNEMKAALLRRSLREQLGGT